MKRDSEEARPNIYLVGFMGVGKTAIGKRLARALRFRFIDSDRAVEKSRGKSIPEIFETEGEDAFRAYERAFVESGHPSENTVVSCGGGLVIQEGMAEKLRQKGVVVCLFTSPEKIVERTSRTKKRPLLNVDDPEARVRELLAEREPIYMRAGTCITTEDRSIPEVVDHIARVYRREAAERAGRPPPRGGGSRRRKTAKSPSRP